MNEKRLFDSLVEIQKDLTVVINKMKSLSMDDAFVTHCDFILNNMTILKAVSALKIAVQSYNVYQKPSDELDESPSDMGFDILPEATLDSFVDDDDNNDVSDIMASLESDASDLIKKEKDDDADYDPREETRRKQSPVKKTKGKRGPKPKSRSSIVTKTGRGRSGQQSDPSVEIEYTCPACYMPFKHLVRFKRHIDTYHKDLNVDADSCKTVIDVATASPIVTVLRHSTGDTNGTPQVEIMAADGQASPPTFDDLAQDQGDGTYLCIVCNKTLDSEASMKDHAEFHSADTSFNCTVCEKGFTTASTLRCHMKTHGYGSRFKCSYCSKEFMTKTFRDDHENAEHTGASRFKCDMCNRVFKEAWKLKVHMMKHTGARPYKCSICEKAFHTNAELRVHTKTHNDDMDALCTICGKTFKNRSALNSHMKRHEEGERDFTCKICGKNWYSKGALTEHMMVHSDERPFQCTECGTCFKKNSALNKHMDSHRGLRTKCQHCDEVFPSHYQCRRHELSHREGGNPFVCKYCGKQFDGGTKLRAHVNVHEGIRPFPCTICDKSFFDKKAQKEHIMIHTGIRPYPCTICDKSFFNKKALKEHTMIHTGEKRHKCKYCGSSYTQSSTLGKHIKTVHATEYAAEGVTLVEAFQNKIKEARSKGILVGTIGFRKAIKVGGPEDENMNSNMDSNKSDEDALAETEAAAPADVLQAPESPPHPTADPSFAGLNLVKEPSSGPPAALAAPLDYGAPSIIGQSHQRALLQQQQQQQQAAALQETYNSVSSLFQLPGTQYYY